MKEKIEAILERITPGTTLLSVLTWLAMGLVSVAMVYAVLSVDTWTQFGVFGINVALVVSAATLYFILDHLLLHTKINTPHELKNGNVAVALWASALWLGICWILARV